MVFRSILPSEFDRAMEIAWYSNKNEYYEAKDMFTLFGNQFIGSFEESQMTGFCFGWPIYVQRDKKTIFLLRTISIVENLRNQSIGSKLLNYWESKVWDEYDLSIGLGSTADEFYLRNNYTFLEHCIKTDIQNYQAVETKVQGLASRIEYSSFPTVSVLIKNKGVYDKRLFTEMISLLKSENYMSFFEKQKNPAID